MQRGSFASAIVIFLISGVARADSGDHARAVVAFEDARKLIDGGDCELGVVRLEESLRWEPSVGAHLAMADCLEASDPLTAWANLREAERLAYLKHDEQRKLRLDRAAALEARLPIVRIALPPSLLSEPALELRVDGARIDPFFYSNGVLAMKPGAHVLDVTVPHRRWSQRVVAQSGAATSVAVNLTEDEPRPARTTVVAPEEPVGQTQRALGLVIGGVGVAALGFGGAFGVVALAEKSDIENACGGNPSLCTAARGSVDAARARQDLFAHLSTIGLIAGGAFIAGGCVVFLTAPHAKAAQIGLTPSGLVLSGRF